MNKRNIIIYVAGKYTGKTIEERDANIKLAEEHSVTIWNNGYTAFTPHLNSAKFDDPEKKCHADWQAYMDGYLEILSRCDILYLLPGWENSKGACIEEKFACKYNIPVEYNTIVFQGACYPIKFVTIKRLWRIIKYKMFKRS